MNPVGGGGLSPEVDDPERLLTVEDVCEWFAVTRDWVYDEVEARRLPFVRLGRRRLRFHRSELQAYLDDRSRRAAPRPTYAVELFGGLESLD